MNDLTALMDEIEENVKVKDYNCLTNLIVDDIKQKVHNDKKETAQSIQQQFNNEANNVNTNDIFKLVAAGVVSVVVLFFAIHYFLV